MDESQRLIADIETSLNQPLDQWIDRNTASQLRTSTSDWLMQLKHTLGEHDPQVITLYERFRGRQLEVGRLEDALQSDRVGLSDIEQHEPSSRTHASNDQEHENVLDEAAPVALHIPTTPLAPVEVQLPPLGGDSLDDPSAFGQAMAQFRREVPFTLQQKLLTGHFSTGYLAIAPGRNEQVIVKFPAEDAWLTRFEECARALRSEASLVAFLHTQVLADASSASARVVRHIAAGEVSIAEWPQPVPWLVQSFARGHRLSEPGTLPMRDQQEQTGLRILAQVLGLVEHLYRYDVAHLDLKEDCLFWDSASRQVEVIDWNRARQHPSQHDKALEFAAIQRLILHVLLGPLFQWSSPQAVVRDLFATFQGIPLSRGVRLLLMRLFEPTPMPHALRSVADIYQALAELVAMWDTPLDELLVPEVNSPQAHSQLLNQLSIELQRLPEESPNVIRRRDWYKQAMSTVQQYMQSEVGMWVAIHETMRPGFARIEQIWYWLPDVWPVAWIVPLARAWFNHLPRQHDKALAEIVQAMLKRRWNDLDQLAQRAQAELPADVQDHVRAITRIADAYRTLDQIEDLLRESPPNYAQALDALAQVREVIPLDLRVIELAHQIEGGVQGGAQIATLLREAADARQQPPSAANQRRLLHLMQQLKRLGLADPRYATQQQIVEQIDQADHMYAQALDRLQQHDWLAVTSLLAPWQQSQLPTIAPDVAKLIACTADQARVAYFQSLHDQLADTLLQGQFAAAHQLIDRATSHEGTDSPENEAERQFRALAQLASPIEYIVTTLQHEQFGAVRVALPDDVPLSLQKLISELRAVAEYGRQLEQAATLHDVQAIAVKLNVRGMPHTPIAQRLYRPLVDQAAQKLEDLLLIQLQQPALTDEALAACEAGLHQVQASSNPRLHYALSLLRQRKDQRRIDDLNQVVQGNIAALVAAQADLTLGIGRLEARNEELKGYFQQEWARQRSLIDHADQPPIPGDEQRLEQPTALDAAVTSAAEARPARETFAASQGNDRQAAVPRPWLSFNRLKGSSVRWPGRSFGSTLPSSRLAMISLAVAIVLALAFIGLSGIGRFWYRSMAGLVSAQPAPRTPTPEETPAASRPAVATQTAVAVVATSVVTATIAPVASVSPAALVPVDVTASPQQITDLTTPIILAATEITTVSTLRATFGEGVSVPLSAQVVSDSLQATLPITFVSRITQPFTLPLTIMLELGEGFKPVPIRLEILETNVHGVDANNPALKEYLQLSGLFGAYLWRSQEGRGLPGDAVKPQGVADTTANYILLNNTDRVKILGGTRELYRVQVVTNQADKNSDTVVGREGWVLRQIIDGSQ